MSMTNISFLMIWKLHKKPFNIRTSMRFSLNKNILVSLKSTKNKNFGMQQVSLNLNNPRNIINKSIKNLRDSITTITNKKSFMTTIDQTMITIRSMIIEIQTTKQKDNNNQNNIKNNKEMKEIWDEINDYNL